MVLMAEQTRMVAQIQVSCQTVAGLSAEDFHLCLENMEDVLVTPDHHLAGVVNLLPVA